MTPRLRLTTAGAAELPRIQALLARDGTAQPIKLDQTVADGAVLIAERSRRIVAVCAVEVAEAEIAAVLVRSSWRRQGIGRRLVEAAERLAVRFGMLRLGVHAPAAAEDFFRACGYEPFERGVPQPDPDTGELSLYLCRHFPRRQTRFGARVRAIGESLGVPADYGRRHRLRLQPEATDLVAAGEDAYGRPCRLTPATADAWRRMRRAAAADGVTLQAASTFRSVDYQADLIEKKLARGQTMSEILSVSAAPGFSEHHSGRALDLTTPGSEPLEEEFEGTEAHAWLYRHAAEFGFRMSYPRNNGHGICFEPWHWCFGDR